MALPEATEATQAAQATLATLATRPGKNLLARWFLRGIFDETITSDPFDALHPHKRIRNISVRWNCLLHSRTGSGKQRWYDPQTMIADPSALSAPAGDGPAQSFAPAFPVICPT